MGAMLSNDAVFGAARAADVAVDHVGRYREAVLLKAAEPKSLKLDEIIDLARDAGVSPAQAQADLARAIARHAAVSIVADETAVSTIAELRSALDSAMEAEQAVRLKVEKQLQKARQAVLDADKALETAAKTRRNACDAAHAQLRATCDPAILKELTQAKQDLADLRDPRKSAAVLVRRRGVNNSILMAEIDVLSGKITDVACMDWNS